MQEIFSINDKIMLFILQEDQIVLTITNPTDSVMTVNFRPAEDGDEDFEERSADVRIFAHISHPKM